MITSSAILFFWPAQWGGLISFAWSTPVVILAAVTLGYRLGNNSLSWTASGMLLLIPSIGVTAWSRRLMVLDLPYLLPHESVPHFMTIVQRELSPIPPILLSTWVASFWFKSPPVRLFLGITTFAAIIAKHYIDSSSIALHHGDFQNAAHQLMWTGLLRNNFAFASLFVVWKSTGGVSEYFSLSSPSFQAGSSHRRSGCLSKSVPETSAPQSEHGDFQQAAAIHSPSIDVNLIHRALKCVGWPWWCDTDPVTSGTTTEEPPYLNSSHQAIADLYPVLSNILYRGVIRSARRGNPKPLQTARRPSHIPLQDVGPPTETYWRKIIGTQPILSSAALDPIACALWVPEDVTIKRTSERSTRSSGICDHSSLWLLVPEDERSGVHHCLPNSTDRPQVSDNRHTNERGFEHSPVNF